MTHDTLKITLKLHKMPAIVKLTSIFLFYPIYYSLYVYLKQFFSQDLTLWNRGMWHILFRMAFIHTKMMCVFLFCFNSFLYIIFKLTFNRKSRRDVSFRCSCLNDEVDKMKDIWRWCGMSEVEFVYQWWYWNLQSISKMELQ